MPVYVTEAQVAELLTPAEAVAAVEASFARLARGAVDNPPRVRAALPDGELAVMPCVDRELGYAGLKSFVCAVGANDLDSRELGDEVLRRSAFICTDSRAQAELEAGDLAGISGVHELQDVVAGTVRGRENDDEITLFKSNGLAAWDLAAA